MSDMNILAQIINRDCHVSLSNRDVFRHVIGRLKEGKRTYRQMPREDRREMLAACVEIHRENWELYRKVMSGRF